MRSRDWTKETVLVIGTGISGIGAVHLLHAAGAQAVLLEEKEGADEVTVRGKLMPEDADWPLIVTGALPEELRDRITRVVPSPGVPMNHPIVAHFLSKGIPVDSEVELAFQFEKGHLMAITGTNGKTTTTSLAGAVMQAFAGRRGSRAFIVGNIGRSYALAVPDTDKDSWSVGEISSFQLEAVTDFHPQIAAVTNITPDHLDRHGTMEAYIAAKLRIAENMEAGDVLVLNYEDPVLRAFGKAPHPFRTVFFSSGRRLRDGYFLDGTKIVRASDGQEEVLFDVSDMQLVGMCNYENVMTVFAVCEAAGVPAGLIADVTRAFPPVEHRIEYVATVGGVKYYNDSKATNPDAAIQGIRAMSSPTFLIAGGYDKGSDYAPWIRAFDGKVKELVLTGKTRDAIAACAREQGIARISVFDSLDECLAHCAKCAEPGDAVLLSPACASWGMFPNFEARGKAFKEFVMKLAGEKK
ncbi:MAG: UDP-N-acetylmuramoyl-L-alanine--D-glutamate ligase [Lachnospiraceae bacterium]|nr:UDP-N-acetylmuramoyl-L-alanine--D-glutamate ligase [Lachnospiraceae bacterium]